MIFRPDLAQKKIAVLPTHALETRSSLLNRRRSRRPLHWLHWSEVVIPADKKTPVQEQYCRLIVHLRLVNEKYTFVLKLK